MMKHMLQVVITTGRTHSYTLWLDTNCPKLIVKMVFTKMNTTYYQSSGDGRPVPSELVSQLISTRVVALKWV